MVGGYQLIDMKGIVLQNETTYIINGIYEKIKNAYENKKQLIFINIVIDEDFINSITTGVKLSGDKFITQAIVFAGNDLHCELIIDIDNSVKYMEI